MILSKFLSITAHLFLGLLCLLSTSQAETTTGEGGEIVIKSGFEIRELPPTGIGSLPQIAIGTAEGIHYLYDPNRFVMEGYWTGLFGRTSNSGTFVPANDSMKSFAFKGDVPWRFGKKKLRSPTHTWSHHELVGDQVFFHYNISDEKSGLNWKIKEHLEYVSPQLQHLHFEITPSAKTGDSYLSYWVTQVAFRRLSSNGQQNQRNKLKCLFPDQDKFTLSFLRRKETPTIPHGYSISPLEIPTPPAPHLFEPTSMAFAEDGTTYVSTRIGDIWSRTIDGTWNQFATGLNETNGIEVAPDVQGVYVMQRPELTLLRDTNGDGIADLYKTVEDRFRFTGQYHEFAYGPRQDSAGALYFSLGLSSSGHHRVTDTSLNQMTTPLGYRGWVLRHNPDGTLTPFASGLRSPAGIGMNAKDELFVTDNQGDWVASSYLSHVEEGDFLGHPAALWDRPEHGLTPALLDYKTNEPIPKIVPLLKKEDFAPTRKHPAVWLAHNDLTNSPGHPSFAPETGFGPFGGQAFITDIAHRTVVRCALEKVGGKYQGAVFPFIRPLQSAAYSTCFSPTGDLWIGSVGRGWVEGPPAIEIISFDDSTITFEIHRIALTKDGFDIILTAPIDTNELSLENISVTENRYRYWDKYGSTLTDESTLKPTAVTLLNDRTTISISIPRKPGFLYNIQLPELKSATGLTLENNYGIYTLNQLLP